MKNLIKTIGLFLALPFNLLFLLISIINYIPKIIANALVGKNYLKVIASKWKAAGKIIKSAFINKKTVTELESSVKLNGEIIFKEYLLETFEVKA